MLILAVDSGGTKTHGVLANEQGKVLANHVAGPCNLTNQGVEGCEEVLSGLLETLSAQANVNRKDITHAFLALGGLDTEKDRHDLSGIAARLFCGCQTQWRVENDVLAALFSGTWGAPGIVLLAGTGSMVMGLDAKGYLGRAGGWGFMVGGDPGSASDVGQRLMLHALRDFDAGKDPDDLTQSALGAVGAKTPPELVDWVEGHASPHTQLAQLARIVGDEAEKGNLAAKRILQDAANGFVAQFHLLHRRLDFGGVNAVPVVLAGGMFRSSVYTDFVRQLVTDAAPPWYCVIPMIPPVGGAFLGALRMSDQVITEEIVHRFGEELADGAE